MNNEEIKESIDELDIKIAYLSGLLKTVDIKEKTQIFIDITLQDYFKLSEKLCKRLEKWKLEIKSVKRIPES